MLKKLQASIYLALSELDDELLTEVRTHFRYEFVDVRVYKFPALFVEHAHGDGFVPSNVQQDLVFRGEARLFSRCCLRRRLCRQRTAVSDGTVFFQSLFGGLVIDPFETHRTEQLARLVVRFVSHLWAGVDVVAWAKQHKRETTCGVSNHK